MAHKLNWSSHSRDDLRDIVRFISRDSPRHARVFALRLISQADMLQVQPEMGRMVPEHRGPHIREIIFRPYRIVYRVDHERKPVEVARVWHAARSTPEIPTV